MRGLGAAFLPVEVGVDGKVQGQEDHGSKHGLDEEMLQGPEEIDALEVAKEERRVAKGSEGAADVCHKEDEEDHLMHAVLSVGIGAQEGTDEQHGCTRGTHPARKHGTCEQKACVHCRSADKRALEAHAACDRKEGKEQDDKGNVLKNNGVQALVDGCAWAVDNGTGHKEGHAPEHCDLAEVMFPEMGKEERSKGNGKEHAGKGNCPENGKFRARNMRQGLGSLGKAGHKGQDCQNKSRQQGQAFHKIQIPPRGYAAWGIQAKGWPKRLSREKSAHLTCLYISRLAKNVNDRCSLGTLSVRKCKTCSLFHKTLFPVPAPFFHFV